MIFPFEVAGLTGWADCEIDGGEIAFVTAQTNGGRLDAESLAVLRPWRDPIRLSDWLVEEAHRWFAQET